MYKMKMKLKLNIPNVDYIEIDNVDEAIELINKLALNNQNNFWVSFPEYETGKPFWKVDEDYLPKYTITCNL